YEFEQALYPCLVASTALVVVPLGGVAAGPIIGSVLLGSAGSLCAVHVAALIIENKIYHDPPDPAFHRLAHVRPAAAPALSLPSCSGLHGKERATCRKLEALMKRYAAAAQHVSDVATALSTTANRFSAANAAGDAKAASKQERAAAKLVKRLR